MYSPCHLILTTLGVIFFFFPLPINNYRQPNGSQTLHYLGCQELDNSGVAFLAEEQAGLQLLHTFCIPVNPCSLFPPPTMAQTRSWPYPLFQYRSPPAVIAAFPLPWAAFHTTQPNAIFSLPSFPFPEVFIGYLRRFHAGIFLINLIFHAHCGLSLLRI